MTDRVIASVVRFFSDVSRMSDSILLALIAVALFGSLLAMVVGTVFRFSDRTSASVRHFVSLLAIATPIALPLVASVVPHWGVLPGDLPASIVAATQPATQPATAMTGEVASPRPMRTGRQGDTEVSYFALSQTASAHPASAFPVIAIVIWILGVVGSLSIYLAGVLSLWRMQRKAVVCRDSRLTNQFDAAMRRISVARNVRLLLSKDRGMPMQWGILRPRIVLPEQATSWDSRTIEVALLHELAHVKRWDCFSNLVAFMSRSLLWFNPLTWWLARRVSRQSEHACDDLLLRAGVDACDYADSLLAVTKLAGDVLYCRMPCHRIVAMGMQGSQSELATRVTAILDRNVNRQSISGRTAGNWVAACACVLLATSVLRFEEASVSRSQASIDQTRTSATNVDVVRLGYVGDVATGRRSIAGSGHAIEFQRPSNANWITAVEIFASRYGTANSPEEDFHVYLLDEKKKLIAAYPFPYATIDRGQDRWYTLPINDRKVPKRFYVALTFDPHRTKGIYMGFDDRVNRLHSYVGRPTTGFEPDDQNREWMIRAVMVNGRRTENPFEPSRNPFEPPRKPLKQSSEDETPSTPPADARSTDEIM